MIGGDTTRLGEFLPYLLSITSNAVSQRIARQYHVRFGLKVPEWRVMAVLGDVGAATQSRLTALTFMDKVAVNRACKGLEHRALLVRRPHDGDGRSHLLELTAEGRRMFEEIMPLATQLESQLLDHLGEGERETLKRILAILREAALND